MSGFELICCDSIKILSIRVIGITLGVKKLLSTVCIYNSHIDLFRMKNQVCDVFQPRGSCNIFVSCTINVMF